MSTCPFVSSSCSRSRTKRSGKRMSWLFLQFVIHIHIVTRIRGRKLADGRRTRWRNGIYIKFKIYIECTSERYKLCWYVNVVFKVGITLLMVLLFLCLAASIFLSPTYIGILVSRLLLQSLPPVGSPRLGLLLCETDFHNFTIYSSYTRSFAQLAPAARL